MKKIRPIPVLVNLAAAVIFGVVFWYFLETVQVDLVRWKSPCCDRCGNYLFDIEQPILAFCAGLSFFASTFLAIRGWTIVLKAMAVSVLCFEIYWFTTFWAAIHYTECTALNYPKGLFPIFGGIAMQIETLVWALGSAPVFLIYNQCRKLFLRDEKPDSSEIEQKGPSL